ncbi:hypothetical protein C5S31_04080 [ANME-1 cluster archaeon GoMg2]|nr:hypothetical protein [ANME-1 cluster archaeon GoMg2]
MKDNPQKPLNSHNITLHSAVVSTIHKLINNPYLQPGCLGHLVRCPSLKRSIYMNRKKMKRKEGKKYGNRI